MSKDYNLTKEQQKLFNRLERALNACGKANIYVWSNSGTISAVNGEVVRGVSPDSTGYDELLEIKQVSSIDSRNFQGENADDACWVKYQ